MPKEPKCPHLDEVWKLFDKFNLRQHLDDPYCPVSLICDKCNVMKQIDLEDIHMKSWTK